VEAAKDVLTRKGLKKTLSRNGRLLVEQKYNWKKLAERFHQAIEDLQKPHVTVINDFPLLPPRHGGQYRILSLYKNLSRYVPVHYLCLHKESDEIETTGISPGFMQKAIPKSLLQRVFESVLNRLMRTTIDDILGIFFDHRNRLLKREIAQAAAFGDILIVVHPYQWKTLSPHKKSIRIYESLNYETLLKGETLKGFMGQFFLFFVRRIERRAVVESSLVLSVSDEETEAFRSDFGLNGNALTVPNGTDTTKIKPVSKGEKKKIRSYLGLPDCPIAIFIGSAHPPNVEAGFLLMNHIAPKTPEVLYFVIGSMCWILKNQSFCPPNVKLFFELEEPARNELFKTADIAVNPMTMGAGTSLKMFDYLAAGLPVISTALGARGIVHSEKDPIMLCEIDEFPRAIRELCNSPERREDYKERGRRFVEENFDWSSIAQKLYNELSRIYASHQNARSD